MFFTHKVKQNVYLNFEQ